MDYKIIWSPDALDDIEAIGDEDIRELFVFQYRIIYEITSSKIHILTVIHGKRLLEKDRI